MSITYGFADIGEARAEPVSSLPTAPDPPPRRGPPVLGPSRLRSSADLDGTYMWVGPVGSGARVEGAWDSVFGGELAVLRIREGAGLGAIGAAAGAAMWTERGGGRLWLEAVAGTRLGGRMYGVTAGPLLELAELAHPRLGAAIGAWGYFGVAPFARVGAVEELGAFVELGVRISIPTLRY